jgi:hypothetical protein
MLRCLSETRTDPATPRNTRLIKYPSTTNTTDISTIITIHIVTTPYDHHD